MWLAWLYPLLLFGGIEVATLFSGYIKLSEDLHPTIVRKICHLLLVLHVYWLMQWLNGFEFSGFASFLIALFGGFASSLWAVMFVIPSRVDLSGYPLIRNVLHYHCNGFLRDPNASYEAITIEVVRPMVIGSFMNAVTVFALWPQQRLQYLSLIFVTMAFGDGFGELVPAVMKELMGMEREIHQYRYWDPVHKQYHQKSFEGCLAVWLYTFIFFVLSSSLFCDQTVLFQAQMALIITVLEGISPKGLDNVVLFPVSVWMVCTYYCDVE